MRVGLASVGFISRISWAASFVGRLLHRLTPGSPSFGRLPDVSGQTRSGHDSAVRQDLRQQPEVPQVPSFSRTPDGRTIKRPGPICPDRASDLHFLGSGGRPRRHRCSCSVRCSASIPAYRTGPDQTHPVTGLLGGAAERGSSPDRQIQQQQRRQRPRLCQIRNPLTTSGVRSRAADHRPSQERDRSR